MISQAVDPPSLAPAEPFRPFFDRHPEPMWIVDGRTGAILAANDASVRVFGFARVALAGGRMDALCPGAADGPLDGPRTFFRADGAPVDVDVSSYGVDFHGRPARVVLARDLTAERRAQRALEASEARFRAAMEHAPIGMALVGLDGRWLEANRALCRLTGYAEEELRALTFQQITHPDDLHADLAQVDRLLAGEAEWYEMEKRYVRRDGSPVWVLLTASLVRDGEGRPLHFIAQIQDITGRRAAAEELRRTTEALRESEERFRQLAENIGAVFWLHDLASGCTLYVSPAFERIWGRPAEALYRDAGTWLRSIHPDDRPATDPARFAEQPYEQEYRIVRPDGSVRWIRDRGFPIRDGQGRPYRTAGIAEDVTEQREAQAALVQREAHFRSLIENAQDLIMIVDAWCIMRYHSPSMERLLGFPREALAGRDGFDLVHPDDLPEVLEKFGELVARPGGSVRHEYRVATADGGWKLLDTRGTNLLHDPAVGGIVLNSHDVTDRRQAEEGLRLSEEQLRQSQKMEAVGRLAGGIAHDFNNLLTAIQGNVEMLMLEVPHAGAMRDDLLEIKRAATRAASLTRQLLAFSRRQMLAPEVLDLNAVVREMERMLGRVIGEDVQLVTVLGAEHASVLADPGQLEQVVLNLAVNARDAMPRGGTLRIETREVALGEAEARAYPYHVDPGAYVRLAVSDTGVGMAPEVLARVFEPFFTTKEPGRGTGLGLSTVYGIVKQSGGYVWAESEEGRGSVFRVYLPQVNAEPARPEPQPEPAGAAAPGGGVVLLVEDEEGVRSLSRRILERRGYTVLAARNAAQARELFAGNGGRVDLLLTDVVMPHESGRELAEALLPLQPDLRVVFMSGYTDDALIRHGVLEDRFRLLEKPFAPDGLVQVVREALEG